LADDVVGTLFLAWELKQKPWLLAPAMNAMMWQHPATTASLEKLRTWGVRILDPVEGPHACGEGGPGRLAEPEQIAAEVLAMLPKR
jgi:phosphopantothenoylcysteine decarboxylase/phosphopantothenate--cysteine ligase